MSENLNNRDEAFLVELGERVRKMRAIRGMSRKFLAEKANISERYIAKLEVGLGNVSIILLRRVAEVTGTRLEDLLLDTAAHPSDWGLIRSLLLEAEPEKIAAVRALLNKNEGQAQDKTRIALIGLRGAGKSTLGKLLAAQVNAQFIELNDEITREAGLPVNEILMLYGQEGYRRFEQSALKKVAAMQGALVLSTGGGLVSEPLTFDILLSNFYTIWVKASPAEHMSRVRMQGDLRPMSNDKAAMAELITILKSREPLYARAQKAVNTAGLSVENALAALTKELT